jgi:hypothetical protein
MNLRLALSCVLYMLAAPVYAMLGVRKLGKMLRARRVLAAGTIRCPHCAAVNDLDILGTCSNPKCRTTEYGSRLRCSVCGETVKSFDCDACGVTIKVL